MKYVEAAMIIIRELLQKEREHAMLRYRKGIKNDQGFVTVGAGLDADACSASLDLLPLIARAEPHEAKRLLIAVSELIRGVAERECSSFSHAIVEVVESALAKLPRRRKVKKPQAVTSEAA